jgi:ABC-type glycerol-3-phosphate transport system substrate-binding protein
MKIKKIILIISIFCLVLGLTGCKKKQAQQIAAKPPVTLNYYRVFESDENIKPLFNKYQQANPHVNIVYRNFNDIDRYLETIISELAEGKGPDIISVPNTWIAEHYKKISPAPSNLAPANAVKEVFLSVVAKDNIFIDTDGIEKVFGIPLSVDTLALYYNTDLYNQFTPELGKPPTSWQGLKNVSERISIADTENNLIRSGIAIGTGNGILRSSDIYQLLLLQSNANLFDSNYTKFNFASSSKTQDATNIYTGFNNLNSETKSWDDSLGSDQEKEIYAFATGKTAMIFGYSYLYTDILRTIEVAKRNGEKVISPKSIKISETPQIDPTQPPIYLASYYSETVTRNSQNSEEAWKLITYLADPVNLEIYYKNSFKPTSRRELIPEQKNNALFGAFANQLGTATSIALPDKQKANTIFKNLLDEISTVNNQSIRSYILNAQNELNQEIGIEGAVPPFKNKPAK